MSAENQRANIKSAALAISEVIKAGHEVIVTHGNGPQIGLLALQSLAYGSNLISPIDVLDAETEGMIGYLIEQELANLLPQPFEIATLLTQIEVDPDDPAFKNPTKPIGPNYDLKKATDLKAKYGWEMMLDGSHFRRAVPSPHPKRILEINVIQLLIKYGIIVICAGGGGIPVIQRNDGSFFGVEAVIDKDFASALLAREIKAAALLLLTDVDGVYLGWGTEQQRKLAHVDVNELSSYAFAAGSMGPKVQAALEFVSGGGSMAGIGRLEDALALLDGKTGTMVVGKPKATVN